jgi:hypothetical protein
MYIYQIITSFLSERKVRNNYIQDDDAKDDEAPKVVRESRGTCLSFSL